MIDIDKLARESGASRGVVTGLDWWTFSPDELQLYTEKVMLAAQAAEMERAKVLVDAMRNVLIHTAHTKIVPDQLHVDLLANIQRIASAAIAKYEDEK